MYCPFSIGKCPSNNLSARLPSNFAQKVALCRVAKNAGQSWFFTGKYGTIK